MGTALGQNTGFKVYLGIETVYANTLWACGYNTYGTIGNGTTNNSTELKQVGTLTNWSKISSGSSWTAAIKTNGTLWTWGYNGNVGGYNGFLGNGTTISYSSPVQIGALTNWSQVSAGGNSGLAIKTDGTLWAWGRNEHGQLGTSTNVGSVTCFSSPIQIGALTDYSQVSTSGSHTMFVKTNGTLWGCGYARNGGLGNEVNVGGNPGRYPSPIQIGALTNWSKVVCGYNCAMAIKTDGTLWGWGQNTSGTLGNGTTISYSSPIQVGALTNWSKITLNYLGFLAIKTDGTLWAAGYNYGGSFGNGTTAHYSSPIQIGSLNTWYDVSTKDGVTVAVKTDGTLWGCGYNNAGQLGDGTTINKSSPIQIGNYNNWGNISAGGTVYAIPSSTKSFDVQQDLGKRYVSKDYLLDVYPNIASATGARTAPGLFVCGYNRYGQLGNGTTTNYSSPIQIGSLTNWKQTSMSHGSIVMAVKTDGTLWACGQNNMGQLGNGTTIPYSSPIQIGALTNWKQVSAGVQKFIAIKTDGTLWACGYNGSGSLGTGVTNQTLKYSSPVQIGSLTNWKQAACGFYSGGAIKTDGTLWTWGWNNSGELGNGTTTVSFAPVQIGALTNWKQLEMSNQVTFAIKTDGTLWAWGQNDAGQLGLNVSTTLKYSSPVQIGALTNWKQISCQLGKTVGAIKTDGTLWAWGQNDSGQLGNGTTVNYSSPVQVGSLTNWKQVSAGFGTIAAIKTDGTLWTCGYNNYGGLGNGTTINYSSPIQIGYLTSWKQVSCAYGFHAIADGYY